MILGIDTSNYTTSLCLLNEETGAFVQKKQLLPVKPGEAGLRQSDAVFHHTKQLPELMEALEVPEESLTAIGVSSRPRNVEGSYMPCFLAGYGLARSLAKLTKSNLHVTSHQVGHILAALHSAKKLEWLNAPFLAFHVSGGTTDLLLCEPDPEMLLKITQVGSSLDLKAGQAVDRVGLMMGLQFPCGKALEQLALQADKTIPVKKVLKEGNCCLSGLQNQCEKLLKQGETQENVAKFCLQTIAETVFGMVSYARRTYGNLPIIYAGGVMSNQMIRPRLLEIGGACFSEPDCSCDNAVGTAVYAALLERNGKIWQS